MSVPFPDSLVITPVSPRHQSYEPTVALVSVVLICGTPSNLKDSIQRSTTRFIGFGLLSWGGGRRHIRVDERILVRVYR